MTLEKPSKIKPTAPEWGSDAIADLLRGLDLKYLTMNPGATFRGLQDSLVNYLENRNPQTLLTLHEESAVAIAHGYAKVTDRPMGVVLHSHVGLMHATMAIFNAWCDRVPILVIGATGPLDAARRRPWIDWIHTAIDQGALVRGYTKWDDQPASIPAALESLLRAFQICRTEPPGPVFISLDAALQESRLEQQHALPDLTRFGIASPSRASREDIQEASDLLLNAERPLLLPGRVTRSRKQWDLRVRLAEVLGARVISDMKIAAAFPTRHPFHVAGPSLFLSQEAISHIRASDVILSLNWLDLAGTLKQAWPSGDVSAKVIHCSLDSYSHRGWNADYQGLPPVDVPILCEPDAIVSDLLASVEASGHVQKPLAETIGSKNRPSDEDREQATIHEKKDSTIRFSDIAAALNTAIGDRNLCLIQLPINWPESACDFRDPLDYLGTEGGAGIGAAPGIAVGAALALRESNRLPVAIFGDGNFLMGVTALWTAAHYRIPLLIIITNNRAYKNPIHHQAIMARQRSRPLENTWIGNTIDNPPIDLAEMARAQGIDAEGPVETLADLTAALSRAVEALKKGGAYVIDVIIS